jgi:hypothetical protein
MDHCQSLKYQNEATKTDTFRSNHKYLTRFGQNQNGDDLFLHHK